jgi:N-glycosylase/DNA lyase
MSTFSVIKPPSQFEQAISASDFDLEKTLNSGQVFHWNRVGDGFAGAIGNEAVYLQQRGSILYLEGADASRVSDYFALDHPLAEIVATFRDDSALQTAARFCTGLRIIRQPPWECLATFLTSAMKQVQHIRAMSLAVRRRFGTKLDHALQDDFYAYPSPATLAAAPLEALLECRLGFRAKNLLATAQLVAAGEFSLEKLETLSSAEACAELCLLPGVGEKIANCVLLFAYERLDTVPIDVWIARVLREVYFMNRTNVPLKELKAFSKEYFGCYAGYAQQYLFHHWRLTYRNRK